MMFTGVEPAWAVAVDATSSGGLQPSTELRKITVDTLIILRQQHLQINAMTCGQGPYRDNKGALRRAWGSPPELM